MVFLTTRLIAILIAGLLLAACGSALYRWEEAGTDPELAKTYEVKRGDTLYSIAWRYGLDYRELARWNGIGDSFLIHPGQQLRLTATSSSPTTNPQRTTVTNNNTPPSTPSRTATQTAPMPARPMPRGEWKWPSGGSVVAKFGDANATGKGIAIGGRDGEPIVASADGRVVYAGSGLIGYGTIIIVKHSEEFLSAYGHNETIYVREGEQVKQGDRIAAMGRGPGNKPLLHFEIRVNGEAVDPLKYLPPR